MNFEDRANNAYPNIPWITSHLRTNLYSRVEYPVLSAFIIDRADKRITVTDGDLVIAVVISPVRGKSALQLSEHYHSKFRGPKSMPIWKGRIVNFWFFYPEDVELIDYPKLPLRGTDGRTINRRGIKHHNYFDFSASLKAQK